MPEIDTLLVAVGGGGLIGGIAAWFAGRIKIVAVEPEAAPTLYQAPSRRGARSTPKLAESPPIRWRPSASAH